MEVTVGHDLIKFESLNRKNDIKRDISLRFDVGGHGQSPEFLSLKVVLYYNKVLMRAFVLYLTTKHVYQFSGAIRVCTYINR